ncbi:MAG: hypothetical protein WD342_19850, partial [Verrucomicrobiales bacterium]
MLNFWLSFKFAERKSPKIKGDEPSKSGFEGGVKIKNFQAVYPFKGYVIESVNCQSVGIQVNLRWDRRRELR